MEQDAYHLIVRSAFGDLYFWGERSGHSLTLSAVGGSESAHKSGCEAAVCWMGRLSLD
jgi:GAD-like domain